MRRLGLVLVGAVVLVTSLLAWPRPADSGFADEHNTSYFLLLQASDGFKYEVNRADRHGNIERINSKSVFGRPAVSRDGNLVAFTGAAGQGDLGIYRLFVMNSDGSGQTQLTNLVGADLDPAWSPDGSKIAFSRDASGNLDPSSCCDIVVIDADGTNVTKVPNTTGGRNPVWSPDGERFAFETLSGIFTIDVDGSGRAQVAGPGAREPAWSPSGDEIAYVRATNSAETNDELVILDLSSSTETTRYEAGARIEAPTWVGDSIYIVTYNGFGYDGRNGSRLRIVHSNGSSSTVLNPSKEMVFASQTLQRCHGMTVGGGFGGAGVEGISAVGDCMGTAVASGDFNDDGQMDLAAGVSGDRERGAVNVLYGSASGITTSGDGYFDQSVLGAGTSEPGDRFGEALAVGDFNDDGYDDLAVGSPGEDVNGDVDSGAVNIIYGSAAGLGVANSQIFHQDSPGIGGASEPDDRFGESLAAGDIDGDGNDDLVIGKPGEEVGGKTDTGAIGVLYGSASGLSSVGEQTFNQGTMGIRGKNQPDDRFGEAIDVGDVDGDGFDDVLIGAPGEDVSGNVDAGAVHVIFGTSTGLTSTGDQRFTTKSNGVMGGPQDGDLFGKAVALGDVDGDGFDDAIVGSPGENVGSQNDAGAISVLFGRSSGLTTSGDQRFKENTPGIGGTSEADDRFGEAIAVGRIDGDNRVDVVVGVPGEGVNGHDDAGAVNVIYGSPFGLTSSGSQRFTEDTSGIRGNAETDDRFGEWVALGDLDGNNRADLVVGSPGEGVGGAVDAGAVAVIYASGSGLTSAGDQRFTQDS